MEAERSFIQTYLGSKFFPLAPNMNDFDVRDQARALSMLCRFVGHVKKFYSVAEHAVRVSRRVEELAITEGKDDKEVLQLAKFGLVHDNAEAYLGDVSTPVKMQPALSGYRKAEEALQRLIFEWLGLPPKEPELVKAVDAEMLSVEVHQLKDPGHLYWDAPSLKPAINTAGWVLGWDPKTAETIYLKRFSKLFGNAGGL